MVKQHFGGLDLLKIIMSLMVVGIHTNPFVSYPFADLLTANGLFRIAVPVFFVMNGYFLNLEKEKFIPWFGRLMGLYLLLTVLFAPIWMSTSSWQEALSSSLFFLLFGWHHLWYLAALIVASLLVFLLQRHLRLLLVLSIGLFVAAGMLQFAALLDMSSYVEFAHDRYYIYRNALTVALPFVLIGYFLARVQMNARWVRVLLPISIMLMLIEIVGWNNKLSDPSESRELYFSLLLVAPLLFLFAKDVKLKLHDHLSARIYYFHPAFRMEFKSYGMYGGMKLFLMTTVLSALLAYGIYLIKSRTHLKNLRLVRLLP